MLKKIGFILLIILFLSSCGNEKVIQLPEVKNAKITEVLDVSPAYIFYDESKPDSVELNRKNLIISTNWLFNVDKRLTLEQAIPKIKFLQDKKRHAKMHKNEAAKNYYTCNDTSIKNLGFIEFTDVEYKTYQDENDNKIKETDISHIFSITIKSLDEILIDSFLVNSSTEINGFIRDLKSSINLLTSIDTNHEKELVLISLSFNRNLNFQEYISIKSELLRMVNGNIIIDNNEYIF